MSWSEALTSYGPTVAKVFGLGAVVIFVARYSTKFATRAPQKLQRQAEYLAPKVVYVFGALIILGSLGVNVSSFLALLATLGIGAALVFTPVGQNLIAGFLAGIDDVVREGDVIEVKDRVGKVSRKGALSLGVLLPDGSMFYVPNTKAVDDEFLNHSRSDAARIEVEIKLDGTPNRARAVEIMTSAATSLEGRVQDKPVSVLFTEIGSNALHYVVRVWIEDRLLEPTRKSELLTAVVDALDAQGISFGETSNISTSDFAVDLHSSQMDLRDVSSAAS